MLEKSELIFGKEGKRLNKLLANYQDVSAKLDNLTKVRANIVEEIKAICNHKATYETTKFIFKMNSRKGTDKFDKKGLKEKYLEIFNEFNTVNESVTLTMGEIELKGDRV